MKIQYFSDVHLEFGRLDLPQTDADVIIAAGDIGVGTQGVRWLHRAGKPVIYVAGNHEYYGGDLFETFTQIAGMSEATRIHFLENESAVIDNVRFLGTTLWTDYEGGDPMYMALAEAKMNDFTQITNQSRELCPADILEINWLARAWLREELAKPFDGKTVVVTHHAPLYASWETDRSLSYRGAYCNDLLDIISTSRIDLWFHGHIHQARDYQVNGVRVICNPRGYHGYQTVDGFNLSKTLEI